MSCTIDRRKTLRYGCFAAVVLPMAARPALAQTAVAFADVNRNAIDGTVYISIHPSDEVLVLDGKEYVLNGNGLHLAARRIRLEGHTIIRAFSPSTTPPPSEAIGSKGNVGGTAGGDGQNGGNGLKGGEGGQGPMGERGKHASRIFLDFSEIEGDGTLTIFNNGMKGGRGGVGGPGGPGGPGGAGRNRGGNAACTNAKSPGNGGAAGEGGNGGVGGIGGPGGNGGTIVYAKALSPFVDAGRVRLVSDGGFGGDGGPGGDPGPPGSPGAGGARSHCGGGGDTGSGNKSGDRGKEGSEGGKGTNGTIAAI